MAKHLLVIDGADEGRVFPLGEAGILTIGNSRKNTDICVHDLLASRVHCELELDGDRVVVTDLDDSTGTFVNGSKVRQQELQPGDVVRLGNTYLRLQDDSAAGDDSEEVELVEDVEVIEDVEVVDVVPAKPTHLPAERLHELAEHTLAHFKLGPVLGKGHCGVVFRARDVKGDRPVAVKVLHADFPQGDQEMQRFIKTMKVRLALNHPHFVSTLGVGKSGPYTWIALELVEGESLGSILERLAAARKIDWQRGFRVAVHIGRALDFIHQHRHIHGNVTPRNILVQASDKQTKLGDVLLAQAIEGSAVQQAALEAKMLAELPYLSPEQLEGDAFVDGLSDQYSLGVIVYALLTGRPPFVGQSAEETIEKIREEKPAQPRKFQAGIPEQLERIVLKMLSKNQENRYQSSAELVAHLAAVAEEQGLTV